MDKELVIILDFGGHNNQLIARRIRECNVYCEVLPYNTSIEKILQLSPKGIITIGGEIDVNKQDAPNYDSKIYTLGIPVLGINYGCQLMTYSLGGKVSPAPNRKYGTMKINIDSSSKLFQNVSNQTSCLISQMNIETTANDFKVIASSESCPVAAIEDRKRNLYGLLFHPRQIKHRKA